MGFFLSAINFLVSLRKVSMERGKRGGLAS